jgi:hypothetical protein
MYFCCTSAALLLQIREQIAEHGRELGEEVFRNTEVSMKSLHDLSKQADRHRRTGEADLAAVREAHQVLEIEQSVSERVREGGMIEGGREGVRSEKNLFSFLLS